MHTLEEKTRLPRLGSAFLGTTLLITVASILAANLDAQEQPPRTSNWDIALGAGTVVVPRYLGSDEYWVLPFPMGQVTYRGRIYVGPTTNGTMGGGIGSYLVRTGPFRLAAEMGLAMDRPADRADALAGMTDRAALGTAGLSLLYDDGLIHSTMGIARGLNDHAGYLGTARIGVTCVFWRRVVATADGSANFANARQMRRELGVSDVEAASRGALIAAGDRRLRPSDAIVYKPDGGLMQVGGTLTMLVSVTGPWWLVAFGDESWLANQPASSPLVRSRNQGAAGLGILWRR